MSDDEAPAGPDPDKEDDEAEKDQTEIDEEDEAKEAAEAKAAKEAKKPKKAAAGDATVTPAQFDKWHERNGKYYTEAEPLSIAELVKRLASEKKRFTTTKLEKLAEDPDFLVDRFTYALVYSDVLSAKLAAKYGPSEDEKDDVHKEFSAAHAAWAGALTVQYGLFFHSIAKWVKDAGKDSPMKVLYERLNKAGFVPVV